MMVAATQMGQQRFAEAETAFSRCVALYDSAEVNTRSLLKIFS